MSYRNTMGVITFMIHTNLFEPTEAHEIVRTLGNYSILEYKKDYSITPDLAAKAYYSSKMNVHKRQVIIEITGRKGVIIQAGAMQLMMGPVSIAADAKGPIDLLKKFIGSKVTEETMFKPHYTGKGLILLEPTFRYLLLEDVDNWNGSMVIEDGMFLACDDTIKIEVTAQSSISAAVAGNEGLFNTTLSGKGVVVLESPVPQEELIIVDLEDDVLRIDGSMAIAWSKSLSFTVEAATDSLIGSAVSGEGLVNVYRGTGRVMIAPVGKALRDTRKKAKEEAAKKEQDEKEKDKDKK